MTHNLATAKTRHLLAAMLLLPLLAAPARADIVSADAPINIEADSAELQESLSTYTGNVKVVQGSVSMYGARLIVRRGRGNSFTFTLSGSPARINQAAQKAGEPDIRGSAQRIDYASGTETLELRGNATIYRGQEKITGGDIRYSFRERRTIVNNRGGGSNGRVQITLQPGQRSDGENGDNDNGNGGEGEQ